MLVSRVGAGVSSASSTSFLAASEEQDTSPVQWPFYSPGCSNAAPMRGTVLPQRMQRGQVLDLGFSSVPVVQGFWPWSSEERSVLEIKVESQQNLVLEEEEG